jgi:hypothetical protein
MSDETVGLDEDSGMYTQWQWMLFYHSPDQYSVLPVFYCSPSSLILQLTRPYYS